MGSSDQGTSHQNFETASALETETVTGSHLFTVCRYSLTKWIGLGQYIYSDVFNIGGYKWVIKYSPDGSTYEDSDYIAFYIDYKGDAATVKAQISFTILRPDGDPSPLSRTSNLFTFRRGTELLSYGYGQFVKRSEFEASGCLKDDAFTVKCAITIVKGHHLRSTSAHGISIPPSNLNQNLVNLLESGEGADVTFVVKGEKFNAHRWMLAARSDVFKAQLFGGMKENWTNTIWFDDIEASVFKSVLYFIYSDSLSEFEGISHKDGEKEEMRLMAQHLLVAADRFQLNRLRLMCEDFLFKNLSVSNVVTTLILADQHNCGELKAQCLRFMSSPEVFKAVAFTDGFDHLLKSCPSFAKDM